MLYQEVKRKLIADIASGAVQPGGALPNERALATRFGVSIGTIRRAVEELVAEHILLRQQGRGTFVGRLDQERFMFQFFNIAGRDGQREFPRVELRAFAKSRASAEEARRLGLATAAPVLRIDNVLWLQQRPVIHDHIVLDAQLFAGLTRQRLGQRNGTIYELYQTDFGVTVVDAEERVRAEPLNPRSAALLGLAEGSAVLRIDRVARSFAQKPAEFRVSMVDSRDFDYVAGRAAPR